MSSAEASHAPAQTTSRTRPTQRPGFTPFRVANELVLLTQDGTAAHALNESAAGIWTLCDGQHTPLDMLATLRSRYDGDDVAMLADLSDALFRFQHQGLIDLAPALHSQGPRVRFVFGIEDRPYFHWQLAILFESLVGQLAPGWDITVVVCNDHAAQSQELVQLLSLYNVRALTGVNHAHSHAIDFSNDDSGYVALNRVEALRVVAAHVAPEDVVCLMDTDVFLYGDLRADLFPAGNAMAFNNIINDRLFMGYGSQDCGIDLQMVLGAMGCDTELQRGGVTVFMTGATLAKPKIIQDCFRFAQMVYLMGRASALPDHNIWVAEMACFAMALTANRVDYALLDTPQFSVPAPQQETLPAGSFHHYYADTNDGHGGPFLGSQWSKHLFRNQDFLAENIESFQSLARTAVEQRFFELSIAARRRRHAGQHG